MNKKSKIFNFPRIATVNSRILIQHLEDLGESFRHMQWFFRYNCNQLTSSFPQLVISQAQQFYRATDSYFILRMAYNSECMRSLFPIIFRILTLYQRSLFHPYKCLDLKICISKICLRIMRMRISCPTFTELVFSQRQTSTLYLHSKC